MARTVHASILFRSKCKAERRWGSSDRNETSHAESDSAPFLQPRTYTPEYLVDPAVWYAKSCYRDPSLPKFRFVSKQKVDILTCAYYGISKVRGQSEMASGSFARNWDQSFCGQWQLQTQSWVWRQTVKRVGSIFLSGIYLPDHRRCRTKGGREYDLPLCGWGR